MLLFPPQQEYMNETRTYPDPGAGFCRGSGKSALRNPASCTVSYFFYTKTDDNGQAQQAYEIWF